MLCVTFLLVTSRFLHNEPASFGREDGRVLKSQVRQTPYKPALLVVQSAPRKNNYRPLRMDKRSETGDEYKLLLWALFIEACHSPS
jgi:hypothetical protein